MHTKNRTQQQENPDPGSPPVAGQSAEEVTQPSSGAARTSAPGREDEVFTRSESAWRDRLGETGFRVLRKEATEPAFTSPLNGEHRNGVFVCAGCGAELFRSESKYDSGTGWPSFFDPIPGAVATKRDFKMLVPRTEYHCSRCGGHQGHVFGDGPAPTGLRYCNNGVALRFRPTEEEGDPASAPDPGKED